MKLIITTFVTFISLNSQAATGYFNILGSEAKGLYEGMSEVDISPCSKDRPLTECAVKSSQKKIACIYQNDATAGTSYQCTVRVFVNDIGDVKLMADNSLGK